MSHSLNDTGKARSRRGKSLPHKVSPLSPIQSPISLTTPPGMDGLPGLLMLTTSRYHTLSQRGNDTTDARRTRPESPLCNDVATTCPDPDLPPCDDDDILVVPTTAPPGPSPCLRRNITTTTVMCPGPYHHHSTTTPPSRPNDDVEPVPPR